MRHSGVESGISVCHPHAEVFIPQSGPAICTIQYTIDKDTTPAQSSDIGQCWHDMVQNPIVVAGYPIPRRMERNLGLEVPMNVLSGLTQCSRINKYGERPFLKGFSTLLTPVRKLNDTVLWHLSFNADNSRIPYPDVAELSDLSLELGFLTEARHIVGWCSEARHYTGMFYVLSRKLSGSCQKIRLKLM